MNGTEIDLTLLNERGWEGCKSIARMELSDIPDRPDIRDIKGKAWSKELIKYFSIDNMLEYLWLKDFTVIGKKGSIVGLVWMKGKMDTWLPPSIGDNETRYLWRITVTTMNVLDMFGNFSNETFELMKSSKAVASNESYDDFVSIY